MRKQRQVEIEGERYRDRQKQRDGEGKRQRQRGQESYIVFVIFITPGTRISTQKWFLYSVE